MSRPVIVLFAGVALLLSGLPALAQGTAQGTASAPPARIGNTYNGTQHEPNPGAVQSNERAAGVAPSRSVEKKEDDTIRQIDRQLLGNKDNLGNPQAPR